MVQECGCFVENCEECQAKGQCSKCLPDYFLYDYDDDGINDSCIICDIDSGCVDQSIIFEDFNLDGTG